MERKRNLNHINDKVPLWRFATFQDSSRKDRMEEAFQWFVPSRIIPLSPSVEIPKEPLCLHQVSFYSSVQKNQPHFFFSFHDIAYSQDPDYGYPALNRYARHISHFS